MNPGHSILSVSFECSPIAADRLFVADFVPQIVATRLLQCILYSERDCLRSQPVAMKWGEFNIVII